MFTTDSDFKKIMGIGWDETWGVSRPVKEKVLEHTGSKYPLHNTNIVRMARVQAVIYKYCASCFEDVAKWKIDGNGNGLLEMIGKNIKERQHSKLCNCSKKCSRNVIIVWDNNIAINIWSIHSMDSSKEWQTIGDAEKCSSEDH